MAYLFQRNQNLQPYRALKEIIFIVNRLIMSIKQQSIRLKFTNQLKNFLARVECLQFSCQGHILSLL